MNRTCREHCTGLSRRQQSVFRPLVDAAWRKAAPSHGSVSRRFWYESQVLHVLNACSTKQVAISPHDFTRLMLHFATLANDTGWISRLSTEEERRYRWVIRGLLRDLSSLEGRPVPFEYAAATYCHMNPGVLTIEDAPADFLRPVLQALDSRVRKLLREKGLSRSDLPALQRPGNTPE